MVDLQNEDWTNFSCDVNIKFMNVLSSQKYLFKNSHTNIFYSLIAKLFIKLRGCTSTKCLDRDMATKENYT